jgi:hypothetical protein
MWLKMGNDEADQKGIGEGRDRVQSNSSVP